ncbi:MAG: DUF3015 family protein [Pseudomonadota bacterium]
MNKKLILVGAACSALAAAPSADAREFADIYTECGLGAMIAPTNDAVAAVTNVTWDLGTTAISSNASSPESCNGGKEKSAALIYRTYPELERDIANGEGEHLDTLVTVLEVESTEDFVAALRPAYASLIESEGFADLEREEKAARLYSIVQAAI